MSANTSHHITHRMVPLICQALTASPLNEEVWLHGLTLLASPKLRQAMNMTFSIWLPLLIKGLNPDRPQPVIFAGLRLLIQVAETLEPMKTCLVKSLRALGKEESFCDSEELEGACTRLGIVVWGPGRKVIGRPQSTTRSHTCSTAITPLSNVLPQSREPRDHPLLAEILARNLPAKTRTVRSAWSQTLLSSAYDNAALWMDNLFHATLEASATPEIAIASRLGPLVHAELFQTAFFKCYARIQVDASFKTTVDEALVKLLNDTSLSKEISALLLELVAFFNKEGRDFPGCILDAAKYSALNGFQGDLNNPVPGIVLWYAEQDCERDLRAENIANLVEYNIRVGASGYDSAWSSLLSLRDDYDQSPKSAWITSLGHWTAALETQDTFDQGGPVTTFASMNTRMICYHALGDFEKGYKLAQSLYEGLNDHERRKISHWAAAAAWHMGDYETMADYLAFHPKGTSKSLYKAIIDVHHGRYAAACNHISKGQSLSYDELQTQLLVGPQVALKTLAKTEVLVELQEVIQYKSQPNLRQQLLTTWRARFKRSHADPNSWMKRLHVWTLACPPTTEQLQYCYIDCAKLCEEKGMHSAAKRIIDFISAEVPRPGCKVEYTKLRFDWKNAAEEQNRELMEATLDKLSAHTVSFANHLGLDFADIESEGLGLRPVTCTETISRREAVILARRTHRIGQWTQTLQGEAWLSDPDLQVFKYFSLSCKLDPAWFTGSYEMSQSAMNVFEANGYHRSDTVAVNSYVVPALRGLFQAVRSPETPERMIRALLRLVTLWFRYGQSTSVLLEVQQQLVQTPITCWLMAIPQLIARLGTPHKELQGVLIELLKNIASRYPHAIIWPLLTASQTSKVEHEEAAQVIMDYICSMPDGTRLVSQAELVGRELIRASISWMEKWRNIIDRWLPRADLMEIAWHEVPASWADELAKLSVPETPDEEQFVQQFGEQLRAINKSLLKYRTTRQLGLVNSAYGKLYKLYGEIDAQLNQWKMPGSKLQLATAAPKLLSLRECILTVPGQYDPNTKLDDQAFIDSFQPAVDLVASKQLPRKLVIRSYTTDFTFLLKGNEDLRGDERIMQLFTLINTLLNHESEAFGRNLHLLPYEVIPLSPSAGLLSWVPNTQTLQSMIAQNRDKAKNNDLTNKEIASLLGYDPETFDVKHEKFRLDAPAESDRYDKLSIETKGERLKKALSWSQQHELKNTLWQRSPSAEIWIRRRTNFARTIGVGSFVGHVIGLGDRHGMNILIDQLTWGALHIDFGDLFGVAQDRSYLPEKVPFRLTRMMTNAMELACWRNPVPGSRGSYKQASIITMEVLRNSRSSLLAMLEAFLYDPLLSWTANAGPSEAAQLASNTSTINPSIVPLRTQAHTHAVPQSIVPVRPGPNPTNPNSKAGETQIQDSHYDIYGQIDNSLMAAYFDNDSYMSKVRGGGTMTNAKALAVLAQIERKLTGYSKEGEVLPVKKQVQILVEEATDVRNLAQGYILGWIPQW